MKILNPVVALAAVLAITACSAPGMNSMATRKQLSNPSAKAYVISDCMAGVAYKSASTRQRMAKLMGTSENEVAALYCQRMTNGLASGQITLSDVQSVNGPTLTPKVRKLLLQR